MPMPRGSRPSMAALTRSGAMNAIDIVMLTWRMLHRCRAAMSSPRAAPETISFEPGATARNRFQERRPALDLDRPDAGSSGCCRQENFLEPLGRRFGPWDQQRWHMFHGRCPVSGVIGLSHGRLPQPDRQLAGAHFDASNARAEALWMGYVRLRGGRSLVHCQCLGHGRLKIGGGNADDCSERGLG